MFIHLRTRSTYSFLESLASPTELAQAAARLEMPALALTDHRGLTGAIEFYDACQEAGVKPILGLELDVTLPANLPSLESRGGQLALLAADLSGWRSLCRLSSAVLAESPDPDTPLPFERLVQETQGLICLSGGRNGWIAHLLQGRHQADARACLERLQSVFPGRLYLEMNLHTPEDRTWVEALAALADALGLPVAAAHNVYYLTPEQAALQRTLAAMRLNTPLQTLPESASAPPAAHFATPAEMATRFAAFPTALAATLEIAERCRLELPLGQPRFPAIDLLPQQTPIQVLRHKAHSGALRLYGVITPTIQSRLDHELAVIDTLGYASLFLIVEEILGFAYQRGVPVSSRGSAASSLVAHCLGITSPDPLRLNLYFERFLNPARATPPDIDTDLCSRRRDQVIDFVYRRYGHERVAMVCTISRLRSRSALREVAKAHGLPPSEVSRLAESLPHRWYGPPERFTASAEPFAELSERYPAPVYQAIFRDAAALLGLPHHLSIHPGGIVIAPGLLTDLAPTQMAAKGVVITQFDLESVERLGLVKIDLLGIRGLSVLGDVADFIYNQQPGAYPAPLKALEAIPEDDLPTAELVRSGSTIGCFQIESPGMRATLKEIQASSVDDIMVALALYRPGPLTGGLKDAFVRRHRGQEPAAHLHPALAPLLEDTYGVILYQEQVLRVAHELAGFSLAEADLLRRAMSHFDPGEQMKTLREKFIAGAFERRQVPEEIAGRVWELMAAFAGYGFPKAHAASYAQLAWRAAWCKVHYPAIFMAAVLANWGGYYPQRVYLTEARRMGLAVHPPDVNHAQRQFSVTYLENAQLSQPALFMGLDQVRELTRRTQKRILQARPFHTIDDFLARVDPRPIEAENLVKAGALEAFGTIPALLRRLERGGWQGGQLPLFPFEDQTDPELSIAERAAQQQSILGTSLVAHPLELVAAQIASSGALTTVEAAARLGQRLRLAGMRQFWRRSASAHGDHIYFMSLEDLEGMIDVFIPSEVYRRCRHQLSGPGPYLVEGTVELDRQRGEPFIHAERIWPVV